MLTIVHSSKLSGETFSQLFPPSFDIYINPSSVPAHKTSGLIGLHESVTWRAKHFGIYQNLTSKITKFDRSNYFVDEMVKGAFKGFVHEHHFSKIHTGTLMVDVFEYTSPLGILGNLADTLFLKNYMTALLTERNRVLKEFAESKKWETLIRQ